MRFDEFWRYLLPSQLPGEWQAGQPIDLLPAFRACYPNCIDESILALQLQRTNHTESYHFIRFSINGMVQEFPVWPVSEDHEDGYDYSDTSWLEYPHDLLHRLFEFGRYKMLQQVLELFKPDSFRLMAGIAEGAEFARAWQHETSERMLVAKIDFMRDIAMSLADQLFRDTDLVPLIISRLESQPALSTMNVNSKTRWEEITNEMHSSSLLRECVVDDVSEAVSAVFFLQPRSVQLALWFDAVGKDALTGGGRVHNWDVPSEDLDSMKLFDVHILIDNLTSKVMNAALHSSVGVN